MLLLCLQQVPDDYGPLPDDYGRTPTVETGAAARYTPILQVAWRRFSIGRAGDPMPDANSGMNAFRLTWYPISSWIRFGLATEYARESSDRTQHDWYLAEHLSLGIQRPGPVTPFVEASVGAGYLKRFVAFQEQPTGIWEFGVFGGALVHYSGSAFVSAAVGWLRPVWLLYGTDSMSIATQKVYRDSFAFELGLGF